jgi:hypothetical protein
MIHGFFNNGFQTCSVLENVPLNAGERVIQNQLGLGKQGVPKVPKC